MPISNLKHELETSLVTFAWDEWSQMGILSAPRRTSTWAQDPEALLVFTFEIARADPRLFDEMLDWLLINEHLLSVRRLRSFSRDPLDTSLTETVLAWVGRHRARTRFSSATKPEARNALEQLHPGEGFPIRHRDEVFAEHGWLRAETASSGKAQPPDLRAPINFAFRMRQLLGVGARAEVVRVMLTTDAPRITSATIAKSAGYAKRNVQEALTALEQAGVLTSTRGGYEQRHGIERGGWAALLAVDGFPAHVDWAQLLRGLRRILRWLRHAADADLSDYMLASEARDLLEDVRADLEYAGIVLPRRQTSAEALPDLSHVVAQSLELLQPTTGPSSAAASLAQ